MIRQHECRISDVPSSINDFQTLGSTKFVSGVRIFESLFIYKLKPKLNDTQSAAQPQSIVGQ